MNSQRILAIASLIDKNDSIIDVGCDHAYLDIYLIKNKLCIKALASDIAEGALKQAKNNIKKYNLGNKIQTILSNGLDNIDVVNYNTIVISGMGTKTILDILSNSKVENIDKFIIQSNNNLEDLRMAMNKRGYKIKEEIIVLENNKYYTIIEYVHGKEKLSNIIKKIGIYNNDNLQYYDYLYKKNEELLKKIPLYKIKKRISILTLLRYLDKYKNKC